MSTGEVNETSKPAKSSQSEIMRGGRARNRSEFAILRPSLHKRFLIAVVMSQSKQAGVSFFEVLRLAYLKSLSENPILTKVRAAFIRIHSTMPIGRLVTRRLAFIWCSPLSHRVGIGREQFLSFYSYKIPFLFSIALFLYRHNETPRPCRSSFACSQFAAIGLIA